MSTIGDEISYIGQVEVPALGDDFPDRLNVQSETSASDAGGGYYDSGNTSVYSDIPCVYVPLKGNKTDANGKLVSINGYEITMPVYTSDGSRINLDDSHRLVVQARGEEPEKTFQIVSIGDELG